MHFKELTTAADEFWEEVQIALNVTIKRLASDNKTTRHNLGEKIAMLKEENRFLGEELDRVLGRVSEVMDELILLKKAVAQGNVASLFLSMEMIATP